MRTEVYYAIFETILSFSEVELHHSIPEEAGYPKGLSELCVWCEIWNHTTSVCLMQP